MVLHQWTTLPIYQRKNRAISINQSINQSVHRTINQSINQWTGQWIYRSTNQSIKQTKILQIILNVGLWLHRPNAETEYSTTYRHVISYGIAWAMRMSPDKRGRTRGQHIVKVFEPVVQIALLSKFDDQITGGIPNDDWPRIAHTIAWIVFNFDVAINQQDVGDPAGVGAHVGVIRILDQNPPGKREKSRHGYWSVN